METVEGDIVFDHSRLPVQRGTKTASLLQFIEMTISWCQVLFGDHLKKDVKNVKKGKSVREKKQERLRNLPCLYIKVRNHTTSIDNKSLRTKVSPKL